MTFTPKTWHNSPNTTTPLDEDGLNDLESRISSALLAGGGGAILPWAASTAYTAGQAMTHVGQVFTRNADGTSRGTFDATEAAAWTPIYASEWRASPWEGTTVFVDGHSIPTGAGASVAAQSYPNRLKNRLGIGTVTNHAVSGVTSAKVAANQTYNGGYMPQYGGFGLLWDAVVNDIRQGGVAAKALAKFAHALRYSALSVYIVSTASVTQTLDGTFSADVDNDAVIPGGNGFGTTTLNGTATLTGTGVAAGKRTAVTLMAIDNALDHVAGAAYSISTGSDSVTETVVATGTTSNQFLQGSDAAPRGVMPIVVTVATGANPYIKVKKTDANGPALHMWNGHVGLNDVGTLHLPVAVFIKQPYILDGSAPDAQVDTYNALLVSTLTALGGYGTELFTADPMLSGFDKTRHLDPDGLHPNSAGHSIYATAVAQAVASVPYL